MSNIMSKLKMRGDLIITARDIYNNLVKRIEIRNKITFLAGDILVNLCLQRSADYGGGLATGAQLNDQIYTMRMGTGSTAASRADTALEAQGIGLIIGDAGKTIPASGEMRFIATMANGVGNGGGSVTYQEAGLFTKGNGSGATDAPGTIYTTPRLFARQAHPAIEKTAAISLTYDWTIAFTE